MLSLETIAVKKSPFSLTLHSRLDASTFDPDSVGALPLQTYYGIQAQNLPYPVGTTDDLLVPHFAPGAHIMQDATYTAVLNGINVALDCEIVQPSNASYASLPWRSITATFLVVNITTPSCHLHDVLVGEGISHDPDHIGATQNYQGWWGNYTCNDGLPSDTLEPGTRPIRAGFTDHRLLMSVSDVRWTQDLPRTTWLQNLTTIMCKPTYSVSTHRVSLPQTLRDTQQPMVAEKLSGGLAPLPGLTNSRLVPALRSSADNTFLSYFGQILPFGAPIDPLFQLMSIMNGQSGLEAFMEPAQLLSIGMKAFKGALIQVLANQIAQPANDIISGSVTYPADRLQVRGITAIFMVCLLGLAALAALVVLHIHPRDTIPCDPQSLGATATILTSSTLLHDSLLDRGRASDHELRDSLSREVYRSFITSAETPDFVVEPHGPVSSDAVGHYKTAKPASITWWRPISFSFPFAGITVFSPIAVIILLELMQRFSDSSDGLFNLPETNSSSFALMTYLPAIILISLAALYTTLHFNMAVFAPFSALKMGGTAAEHSLSVNLLSRTYIDAFVISLRAGYAATCFSIAAACMSSFLTIIVSGLYFAQTVPLAQSIAVQRADHFDFTLNNLTQQDNLAGATTNLIVYDNLSYPMWTYDDLVFPRLTLPEAHESISNSSSISVLVPAVRPSLKCSVIPPSSVTYTGPELWGYGSGFALLDFKAPIQWPCTLYTGNDASVGASYGLFVNHSQSYVGTASSLQWSSTETGFQEEEDVTFTAGCPTVAYFLGTASAVLRANASKEEMVGPAGEADLYMFYCYQKLEEVTTRVKFQMPGFTIDTASPPIPIESTARLLDIETEHYSGPILATSIDLLISSLRNFGLSAGIGDISYGNYETRDKDYLNPFMQALIRGKDGVPLAELAGSENVDRLMNAANKLYATYMVQAINSNFRLPGREAANPPKRSTQASQSLAVYNGTLLQPDRQRVQQSKAVKCALQGMLAFMAACAILVYILGNTKEVLPHCPCSIAGTMSLLAGSEMVSRAVIPAGSEWQTNAERDRGLWGGRKFRLGWWGDRYGIDVEPATKSAP